MKNCSMTLVVSLIELIHHYAIYYHKIIMVNFSFLQDVYWCNASIHKMLQNVYIISLSYRSGMHMTHFYTMACIKPT